MVGRWGDVENGSRTRPASSPPLAQTLGDGRYTLLEQIGQGGAGVVYRARDDAGLAPRAVCIKRLTGTLAGQHAGALKEEARLLTTVRHANVVALLDVGFEESGLPFLVLELVDGLDLRALGRAQQTRSDSPGLLPDRTAVHVACAVLRALAAIQRFVPGLVHRDVTPHNILVSREGEIKLADFGIALCSGREQSGLLSGRAVRGKFGYMAPEQIRGDALDVRTDLFAVGVVLYELLARTRPFGPMQGMDELVAIEQGAVVPLALHRPGVDRALSKVVSRLIAHDKRDRFEHADDALRALAPLGAGDLGSLRLASAVRAAKGRPQGDTSDDDCTTKTRSCGP